MAFPSSITVDHCLLLREPYLTDLLGQEQGYQGGMDPYNREA